MSLGNELGLQQPIEILEHEAILSIYYTASRLKKQADEFFHKYGLTDVQFNVLMLLAYQSGPAGGLTQAQIGDMMLVNRADITSLIDRMEKARLVVRAEVAGDRRSNLVRLTTGGRKVFLKVEPLYVQKVKQAMSDAGHSEQKKLIKTLEKVRERLSRAHQKNRLQRSNIIRKRHDN